MQKNSAGRRKYVRGAIFAVFTEQNLHRATGHILEHIKALQPPDDELNSASSWLAKDSGIFAA